MPQVVIENPVLNSPYKEPDRHFKFSDEGITNEIVESRRISSYFIPIAKPKSKSKGKQLALDTSWTQDRIEENDLSTASVNASPSGAKAIMSASPKPPATCSNIGLTRKESASSFFVRSKRWKPQFI